MGYDYHVVAAAVGATLGIVSFVPYYRDVLNRSTKPHLFTWIVWTVLTGLTALIQAAEGGGVGALVAAVESVSCLGVALLAIRSGEKNITRFDWICFALALLAIVLWLLAHQPLLAVFLVVAADGLGFAPTFRKSFYKPHEETALQFGLSAAHWMIAIVALQSLTLANWLYPAVISTFDSALVIMLFIRRRQLAKPHIQRYNAS